MTESELFNQALKKASGVPGWQQFYFIRIESMGKIKGYWYYVDDGFWEIELVRNDLIIKKKQLNEEKLYADVENRVVCVAIVPKEKYSSMYKFQYIY